MESLQTTCLVRVSHPHELQDIVYSLPLLGQVHCNRNPKTPHNISNARLNDTWNKMRQTKKLFTLLDLCVSSLRRGHANLLCIVPILTDDPRRESIVHVFCGMIVFRQHWFRNRIEAQGQSNENVANENNILVSEYVLEFVHQKIYTASNKCGFL